MVNPGDIIHLHRDEGDFVADRVELLGGGKLHVDRQIIPVADLLQDAADRDFLPSNSQLITGFQLKLFGKTETDHHIGLIQQVASLTDFPVLELLHLGRQNADQCYRLILDGGALGQVGESSQPFDRGDVFQIGIGDGLGQGLSGEHRDLFIGAPAPGSNHQIRAQHIRLLADLRFQPAAERQQRHQRGDPHGDRREGEEEAAFAADDILPGQLEIVQRVCSMVVCSSRGARNSLKILPYFRK